MSRPVDRPLVPAVRAYTPGPPPRRAPPRDWRPATILGFDVETELSEAQSLTFGSYRLCRVSWDGDVPHLSCVEEGLIFGDDLPQRQPAEFALLEGYRRSHAAAVDHAVFDAAYRLALRSRTDFVDNILRPAAAEAKGLRAWVVTFNGAYDLTRLMAPHLPVSGDAWQARPGFALDSAGRRGRRDRPSAFVGGYSLPIWEYEDPSAARGWRESGRYRPRLAIKHRGTRQNLTGWIGGPGAGSFRGNFFDGLTVAAALTGESQTLAGACSAFGFAYQEELDRLGVQTTKAIVAHGAVTDDYIGYNRADTAATVRLCGAILAEARALGIRTSPTSIQSTASIAKDTLDRLGVTPLLARQPDFDPEVMGYAMAALFGGRTECHVRRTPVPITALDFTSQYPTVSILLGLQDFLTCGRVDVEDESPSLVTERLAAADLDAILDPATWHDLHGIALVDPVDDILPVRADWHGDGTLGIGINRIATATDPAWYTYPDLVASRLLTGKVPRIIRALRFVPTGRAAGLRPVRFGSSVRIDPRRDDIYRALIEERARVAADRSIPDTERNRVVQFLKIVANSIYGITAEMNPRETAGADLELAVHGARSFGVVTNEPEEPGAFFFGLQAALTTAGGGLLLAILELLVTDRGGTWCFADTDSFAVVSSEAGGGVPCLTADGRNRTRALSWVEVDEVRDRINRLNPYNRALVPDLLKCEKVNFVDGDPARPRRQVWAYSVAAKKYVLFEPRGPRRSDAADPDVVQVPGPPWVIVDRREHGLGYLRRPIDPGAAPEARDWVTETWAFVLAEERGERPDEPAWFGLPKMSRNSTLTTPRLLRAFASRNEGRTVADAVKPFNFLNRVFVDSAEVPAELRGLALAAPYDSDPAAWLRATYFDVHTSGGREFRITVDKPDPASGDDGTGRVVVGTYGDVVQDLPLHAEAKSLGPDGRVCGPHTRGLLGRRTVTLTSAEHIRKESSQAGDDGLVGTWSRARTWTPRTSAQQLEEDWLRLLPLLRAQSTAAIARALGVAPSTVKRWKTGSMQPHRKMRRRIESHLG